jgi:diguanylate cyclase
LPLVLVFYLISPRNNNNNLEQVNKKLESLNEELKKLSLIDELTSLWNRRGLLSLAQNRMEKEPLHQMSIIFVDLDGFKAINDKLGHGIGDFILQVVGERLNNCIREGDIVSRIGGDEFVLILSKADQASAEKVSEE